MQDDGLTGRRVLVFGATGALGSGVAEAFRAAGAEVTGVDRAEPADARRLTGVSYAADEVRGTGITVNCVVPSIIDTPANRAAMPGADHAAWPKVPDIARSYVFLASPRSGLTSGAALPV